MLTKTVNIFLAQMGTIHITAKCLQHQKYERFTFLTRFNKIAIQGTPQMAVDKELVKEPSEIL